jgi:hypothetical protein
VAADIGGKAGHGAGQDQVLRVAFGLVDELVDPNPRHAPHFVAGQAIAVHHVHAGDEEGHPMAGIAGGEMASGSSLPKSARVPVRKRRGGGS